MKNRYQFIIIFLLSALFTLYRQPGYAQLGKNGVETISSSNTVVNEYTSLTANASAGNTSLTVSNSALNTHSRFTASLAQGDLIMIIQMQGATINGTATDSTWGTITNYNNCGLYEFSEVSSVPNGTTIDLSCPLKNNYTATGNVQVVRIPRYISLTINNGGILTGDAWGGTTGGIVAVEVQNNTVINTGGSIVATGIGFRGGLVQNNSGCTSGIGFFSENNYLGGAKGEGIAGYETAYNAYGGMFGRGAPANGGGGGDQWNASGGGGANGGNINEYTGNGNPDITTDTAWIAAWNLEYPGFAYSTSSGGGRGGYTIEWFPTGTPSPLVYPPGNPVWGDTGACNERNRENGGGKGGRPLDYSTGRIFAGGGGGAGHEDQGLGGSGGIGGGIVYLLSYGTVSGGGSIISNGQNGLNDNSTGELGDGSGGAGAGGTVVVYSTGTIGGISITANGGNGGNQYISSSYENEGPGGGGGAGYIATSNGNISTQAVGGVNGTTNSPLMTLFPPNGATKGGNGIIDTITSIPFGSLIATVSGNVSVCSGDSASISASGGTSYLWSPSNGLSCSNCADTKAAPASTTTYTVTISNGTCAGVDSVVVSILPNVQAGAVNASPDTLCAGGSSQLTVSGSSGSIQWQYSTNGNSFTNLPADTLSVLNTNNLNETTYYRVEATGTCGMDSSQAAVINVLSFPNVGSIIPNPDTLCAGGASQVNLSGFTLPVQWQIANSPGDFTDVNGVDSSVYTTPPLSQSVSFRVIANNGYCADTSAVINVLVNPAPVKPKLSTNDSLICFSDSSRINSSGSYSSYSWNDGDTRPFTYAYYAGAYWVTVSDANGCSAVSDRQFISEYPVPSVSIVQLGDTLSSFGASSYQWYFDNSPIPGATEPTYHATQTGSYAVLITDTSGCTALSTNIEIVTTGISNATEDHQLNVYPNPFTNVIYIDVIDLAPSIKQVELYDALGRNLLFYDYSDSPVSYLTIDGVMLPAGTYYVKIVTSNNGIIKQLIK